MQSLGFKQKAPPEVQEQMKLHIMAHEYFMMEQATKSPAFAQILGSLPSFPVFADFPAVPPLPPMPPPEEVAPSGPMTEGQMQPTPVQ
jgi:hypothetical protein